MVDALNGPPETTAAHTTDAKPFDYLKAVHDDYRDAMARLHASAEALQDDFKMFVVTLPLLTGAVAGLSGATEVGGIKFGPGTGHSFAFWAFATLTTLVAIIAFRDYLRAIGFEHQLYTVLRYERHFVRLVRSLVPPQTGESVTPAAYFVDKFRRPMARLGAAASIVYLIPTLVAPVVVLWKLEQPNDACILLVYSGTLALAYVVVGQLVLRRFTDLFSTVTKEALQRDDPDPPRRP